MPFAKKRDERTYRLRYRKSTKGKLAHARSEQKYAQKLKIQVIRHYCGAVVGCQCPGCHTRDICFLQADHKNGKGHLHKIGKWKISGKALWLWIINHKFPKSFQILCSNCNNAKRSNTSCPMAGESH